MKVTHQLDGTRRYEDGTRAAVLSDCERYRYVLERQIGAGDRVVLFVMLNPSTADAFKDDPTVIQCCKFASRWGFDRVHVVNMFALRATDHAVARGMTGKQKKVGRPRWGTPEPRE